MTRHPEHIEDNIEHTRSRIEEHLSDLGEQMSPTRLVNSLFRANGESPLDSVDALVDKARNNPVPALLIGAGLAGLFLSGRTSDSPRFSSAGDHAGAHGHNGYDHDPAARIGENTAKLKRRAEAMGNDMAQTAANLKETAKSKVSSVRESAEELVESASGQVARTADAASRKVEEIRSQAVSANGKIGHEAKQLRLRTESAAGWIKENPVPAGLAALAIGAAAASIFTTRRSNGTDNEEEANGIAGEAASNSMHRQAREAGSDDPIHGAERFVDLQEAARNDTDTQSPPRGKTAAAETRKPSAGARVDTAMAELNKQPANKPSPRKQAAGRRKAAPAKPTSSSQAT